MADGVVLFVGETDDKGYIISIRPTGNDMSQEDSVGDFLAHFGVKGMKWGVRKNRSSRVTVDTGPGGRIKTRGGHDRPPAADAVKAARLRQRAKKSRVTSLSNDELQTLLKRMNLEKQYKDLQGDNAFRKGTKFVREALGVGKLGKEAVDFVATNVPKK